MTQQSGVVVIGSMTADVTAITHQLPRRGETVLGHQFTLISGGKGSNQAVMASRIGVPTWMVGCVGNDSFRHVVLDSLRENKVDTSFVDVLDGEKTGVAHIRVDDSANNDIVIIPLANAYTDCRKVDEFFAGGIPVNTILLQLEIPVETVLYAAKRSKKSGLTVIFDPAPAATLPDEIYEYVDIVTPNETEASILTGVEVTDLESAQVAAKILLLKGAKVAIITLGEKGVLIARDDEYEHVPAYTVNAVDTTAAGDAFTGALGACISSGMSLAEAVNHAMAAGALAVTTVGAQSSLPVLDDVKKFMDGGKR